MATVDYLHMGVPLWPPRRDNRPFWVMLVSFVVLGAIVFVWGIDRSGPDQRAPAVRPGTASATVTWDGGTCINLDRWSGSEWEPVASASYEDAAGGVWGPPIRGEQFCNLAALFDGSVSLPTGAEAGTYRFCNIGEQPRCVELVYSPDQ